MVSDTPGSAPPPAGQPPRQLRQSGQRAQPVQRGQRGHAAPAARVLTVGLSLAATCSIITALAMEQPPVVTSSVDDGAVLPALADPTGTSAATAVVTVPAGDLTGGLEGSATAGLQPVSVPSNRTPVPTAPSAATPAPAPAPAPVPTAAPAPAPTTTSVVTPSTTVARTRAS